ncbi:MAG TPA: hypothetical protein VMD97_10780 [Candidatus Aquilonibacter sp.]|nr:hypothetical protein [Candidatus Aquilonibacter sp.]
MIRTPRIFNLLATGLVALAFTASGSAQARPSEPNPCEAQPPTAITQHDCFMATRVLKTYYLDHTFQQNDANEILIALRNMLDNDVKIYLVASQNAIQLYAPPDQQKLAQRIIADLDRPHKIYRLTFTIADSDNGTRVGIQHISMVVAAGQRTVLKQGDKIPIATGTYGKGSDPQQTQFQYLDVGINVDVTLDDTPSGLQLKSKVEQSSVGPPSTIAGVQEPVFRQTDVEGTSELSPGKPLTLGSVDVTGTTRHIDIEVVAEPVS